MASGRGSLRPMVIHQGGPASVTADDTYAEAQAKRNGYIGRQQYKETTGQDLPQPEAKGGLLSDAIATYLSDL